jgi:hypothetical protein
MASTLTNTPTRDGDGEDTEEINPAQGKQSTRVGGKAGKHIADAQPAAAGLGLCTQHETTKEDRPDQGTDQPADHRYQRQQDVE